MVSPHVWGSLATAGIGDAASAQNFTARWYSASALDYHLRKHLTHGISFGNINGMASQLLSRAPAGYVEALKRNLLHFKQYRHLLFEDVYHPKLRDSLKWSSTQYVKEDGSESVVFVFRDASETAQNTVYLRGLDQPAKYHITSLNDRPGRDRIIDGVTLTTGGIAVNLPDSWLAKGDGSAGKEFEDQLRYGSDILLLRRLP
jgi:Glycosyl hydrolase family 36 C-terminal domain